MVLLGSMNYMGYLGLIVSAEAHLYAGYYNTHCYRGHGGAPVDPKDTAAKNKTSDECKSICDSTHGCLAFTRPFDFHHWDNPYADCYFRSNVNVSECDISNTTSWVTYVQTAPPPLTGNILYHLFEPKYTGLADKDAGDFKGDSGFIFGTFSRWSKGNPEASLEHNILEMNEVNVTGWGTYEQCNAPGAEGHFVCPSKDTEYCCTVHDPANHSRNIPTNHTRTQLPGLEVNVESLGPQFGFPGWWMSFPKESQNVTWTEKLLRRIEGKCLGAAWRKDAGGCSECGQELDQCVAKCVQASLCANGSVELLQKTWDRVFGDPKECPDVPLPSDSIIVV